MIIRPLDELAEYELLPHHQDPTQFVVVGAGDFVLGRVVRLLVDLARGEVLYMVVNTACSNYEEERGEERLVPLAWGELVGMRRQIRLPHLSRFGFRRLPLYRPDAVPEDIPFPEEDADLRDIA